MHYFTISSEDNQHLGFLVMMADDEHSSSPDCGCFAIKAQADADAQQHYTAQWRILSQLATAPALYWQRTGDEVRLSDAEGSPIGRLQQQYLKLNGQPFVLHELTGTL